MTFEDTLTIRKTPFLLIRLLATAEFKSLIKIPTISCISPHQHWLGCRFNFGDVQLYSNTDVGMVTLRDVPDPVGLAIQMEEKTADYRDSPNFQ